MCDCRVNTILVGADSGSPSWKNTVALPVKFYRETRAFVRVQRWRIVAVECSLLQFDESEDFNWMRWYLATRHILC